MKSTGIVRGIDGLGRIVLPKELRTNLKINSNSKLEIFVDGDTILLKKYRPAGACDSPGSPRCVPRMPRGIVRRLIDHQGEAESSRV